MSALLLNNWRQLIPYPWSHVALALVAVFCGAIVGSERERREKPAGMRTLVMVTLGASVFTMVSFVFTTTTGDSGRVAAQIVTGIGFLGAGVIMRMRNTITGATTAAMIWVVAAIGTVVGSGHAGAGVALSVLVRMVLYGVHLWEMHMISQIRPIPVAIDFDSDHGKARIRIGHILMDYNIQQSCIAWAPAAGSSLERLDLQLHLHPHHFLEMLDEIVGDPAVKSVEGVPVKIEG